MRGDFRILQILDRRVERDGRLRRENACVVYIDSTTGKRERQVHRDIQRRVSPGSNINRLQRDLSPVVLAENVLGELRAQIVSTDVQLVLLGRECNQAVG